MITVITATAGYKIEEHAEAIRRTLRNLPVPSKGVMISDLQPKNLEGLDWYPITKDWIPRGIWSTAEYCRFLIQGLVDYVDTEHCILVQWDGYAVNRHNWTDEFLGYDYIGAPWPMYMNPGRVGNGGFSLRSKLWLQSLAEPKSSPTYSGESDDVFCCTTHREYLKSIGLKIAPLSLAQRWSIEWRTEEYPYWTVDNSFGFHAFFAQGNSRYKICAG